MGQMSQVAPLVGSIRSACSRLSCGPGSLMLQLLASQQQLLAQFPYALGRPGTYGSWFGQQTSAASTSATPTQSVPAAGAGLVRQPLSGGSFGGIPVGSEAGWNRSGSPSSSDSIGKTLTRRWEDHARPQAAMAAPAGSASSSARWSSPAAAHGSPSSSAGRAGPFRPSYDPQHRKMIQFINDQITQASMLGQLRRLMLRYKANMEAVHVGTLLYTLQHLIHQRQSAALNPAAAAQRLLPQQRHGNRLRPSATAPANLSSAEGLSSIPPPSATLISHSTPYTETDGPTQQLVAQMLGEVGAMAWHFLKSNEMSSADIATALYSWAQLHWHPEPGLLGQAERSFLKPTCLEAAQPLDLVRATWGFSALGHLQPGALEALSPWLQAALPQLRLELLAELGEAVAFAALWEEHGVAANHQSHSLRRHHPRNAPPAAKDVEQLQAQQGKLLLLMTEAMVHRIKAQEAAAAEAGSAEGAAAEAGSAEGAAAVAAAAGKEGQGRGARSGEAGVVLRFLMALHHAGIHLGPELLRPLAGVLEQQQDQLRPYQQEVATALLQHQLSQPGLMQ